MRIFGIDGGIATIGWAVVNSDEETIRIVAAGTRCFDAPETDKTRTPTAAVRRLHRGQRRVIARRALRMEKLRKLFVRVGWLESAAPDALAPAKGAPHPNPWKLRAEGLDRLLTGKEFAVVLGHIARHRGFRSNAKRDAAAGKNDETSKMKNKIKETQGELTAYRTIGEGFWRHPNYQNSDPAHKQIDRKHNRGLNFDRSIMRSDQELEVAKLFDAQCRFGNTAATEAVEADYAKAAFSQRALQDSEHMVGFCLFETDQRCAARRSYSFEMFRLLSRLNAVRLTHRGRETRFDAEQIAKVSNDFGKQKGLTWKWLRRTLDIPPDVRFAGVAEKDEKNDFVARSGNAAEGTYVLRGYLGDGIARDTALADRIAEILTFREDPDSIRKGLAEAGVEPPVLDALMRGVTEGAFAHFKGAGHISAKAARKILPGLARGLVYSAACEDVEYDHAAPREIDLKDVRNPVARKAVGEMLKQVKAMIQAHGEPDRIHVELARDVGKSAEERDKITRGIEDRNKQRDRLRAEFEELLHRKANRDDMLRFELWKEQACRCLYTDELIPVEAIVSSDNRVQVDHILPWSRFGDDSFLNKTLCFTSANQRKRGRTPFEWFEEDGLDWARYAASVEGCKAMKGPKKGRFYLRKNAKEVEGTFRTRNLNDTRYATRLLLGLLNKHHNKDGKRTILARPGQLTAKLRRAWKVNDLKYGPDGTRVGDQNHALDAIVLACTSESMLQKLTAAAREAERLGLGRGFDFDQLPDPVVEEPGIGFREAVRKTVERVFVSRAERRRARGELHAATIKQIREVDGKDVVFERKAIAALTEKDLDNLEDPKKVPPPVPYGKIIDPAKLRGGTISALRLWLKSGKPKDAMPRSPKGDLIQKIRVPTTDKVAVSVRGGTADRGDMARVDVFAKANKRGKREFYLVPIYPHQVADRVNWPVPPDQAVLQAKPESEWERMDSTFKFLFSLQQNSLIEIVSSDGAPFRGYFKGLDRSTGSIAVSTPENPRDQRRGVGPRRLDTLRKLSVDRLGRISVIEQEVRTWHGEVCT